MAMLPLKMAIVVTISEHSNLTLEGIMECLHKDYGTERQFNKNNFSHLLHALKAVGLIKRAGILTDGGHEVEEQYGITPTGINYMKNFPKYES